MTNERKGYRFVGWYVNPELTKRINPGGILLSPTKLYPRWDPIKYPVKYILNKGENNPKNPTSVHVRSGIQKLYPAYKKGKFFKGWYWKNKRMEFLPEGLHEMVILEARSDDLPKVTFETGRGANMGHRTVDSNGYLEPFNPPMRIGYDFEGWFLDPEYRFPFDFKKPLRSNCTLYAKWKLSRYQVDLHLDGGWFRDAVLSSYTYESKTIILPIPKKPGYNFKGWFDQAGRRWRVISSGSIGNITLYAIWEEAQPEVHGMTENPLSENESFI